MEFNLGFKGLNTHSHKNLNLIYEYSLKACVFWGMDNVFVTVS